jgi:hypothetical protein
MPLSSQLKYNIMYRDEYDNISTDEKLKLIMYRMTMIERGDRKHLYLGRNGLFSRMNKKNPQRLFNYWKKRLNEEDETKKLFNDTWLDFLRLKTQIYIINSNEDPQFRFANLQDKNKQMYTMKTGKKYTFDEKLKIIMYRMTLIERKSKSHLYFGPNGVFARMHKKGHDHFFNYWKKRMTEDSRMHLLFHAVWMEYINHEVNKNSLDLNSKRSINYENKDPRFGPVYTSSQESDANKTAPEGPPSLFQKAKNLGGAIKRFASDGFKVASDAEYDKRVEICKGCEFWNAAGYNNTGQCLKCGCATKYKLKMAAEKCPIDKWLPLSRPEQIKEEPMPPQQESMTITPVISKNSKNINEPYYSENNPITRVRRSICNACDKNEKGMCTLCGCDILEKTKKTASSCPINKWTGIDYKDYESIIRSFEK